MKHFLSHFVVQFLCKQLFGPFYKTLMPQLETHISKEKIYIEVEFTAELFP